MRQRNAGHGLDFDYLQDSQIGSSLLKVIKRIMVSAEMVRHDPVASNGMIEHPAESHTVDRSDMSAKPDYPARVLIHDDQHPVCPQGCRLAA
jgi:hypothetical protein